MQESQYAIRSFYTKSDIPLDEIKQLISLQHRNLAQFVDCIHGKHRRHYFVTEGFQTSLLEELQQRRRTITSTSRLFDEDSIQSILFDILSALVYLRKKANFGAHRNLSLETIFLDKRIPNNNVVKLADYFLFQITNRGSDVNFVIGNPLYFSPEVLSADNDYDHLKSDSWAIGLIALELIEGRSLREILGIPVPNFLNNSMNSSNANNSNNNSTNSTPTTTPSPGRKGTGGPSSNPINQSNTSSVNSNSFQESTIMAVLKMSGFDVSAMDMFRRSSSLLLSPGKTKPRTTSTTSIATNNNNFNNSSSNSELNRIQNSFSQWLSNRLMNHLSVSDSLKELVFLCLKIDPHERVDVEDLFEHPYFETLHQFKLEQMKSNTNGIRWTKNPALKSDLISWDLLDFVDLQSQDLAVSVSSLVDQMPDNVDALLGLSQTPTITASLTLKLNSSNSTKSLTSSTSTFSTTTAKQIQSQPQQQTSKPKYTAANWMANVSRQEAEQMLRNCKRNSFLVRPSAAVENSFVLSVLDADNNFQMLHHFICSLPNGYCIEGSTRIFSSFDVLIEKLLLDKDFIPALGNEAPTPTTNTNQQQVQSTPKQTQTTISMQQQLSSPPGNNNFNSISSTTSKENFFALQNIQTTSATTQNSQANSKEALLINFQSPVLSRSISHANSLLPNEKASPSFDRSGIWSSLQQHFYIWKVSTPHLEKNLIKICKRLQPTTPILKLPVGTVRIMEESIVDSSTLYEDKHILVGMSLLSVSVVPSELQLSWGVRRLANFQQNYIRLAVNVREKDIDYQRYRVRLFETLLKHYPQSSKAILQEARIDIPPLLRGQIWSALLGIYGQDCQKVYDSIDKDSENPTDKQIDLDIPRCHQYHPLMASKEGKAKLRRLLKCWVVANTGKLVYWQGLDSVAAPFLVLKVADEAMAYCCLQKFVDKYVHDFYLAENHVFLQAQFVILKQLLAWIDPVLSVHLESIGFTPDLYSLSWFLTVFAHVFSIDKVFRIWDALLVGATSFPYFVAMAVMRLLRKELLPMDFNSCIAMFSNFPEVNIQQCVEEALSLYNNTPFSVESMMQRICSLKAKDKNHNPLASLQEELAPRVTPSDLSNSLMNVKVTLLDIRSQEKWQEARCRGSHNYPCKMVDPENWKADSLQQLKGTNIIVIGDDGLGVEPKFANFLIRSYFPYVSLLNGGFEALKQEMRHMIVYPTPAAEKQ